MADNCYHANGKKACSKCAAVSESRKACSGGNAQTVMEKVKFARIVESRNRHSTASLR